MSARAAAGLIQLSPPAGLMSAYGDSANPLANRRAGVITGRVDRLSAAPSVACSVKPGGAAAIAALTAAMPWVSQSSRRTGSSQQPSASRETPRGPVRRTVPRITSSQEWNTVAA